MILFFVATTLFALVDQIAKYFVRTHINLGTFRETFLPFLKFGHVENRGAAFGSLAGMRIYLILFSIAVIVGTIYFIIKKRIKSQKYLLPISMILGGAISNLLDRIIYGSVTDYIQITFFPPMCNLGDYFICVGAAMIAITALILNPPR